MVKLREEIGMKKHMRREEVGSRLQWTGHFLRASDSKSAKNDLNPEDGRG